jgi:hypothetical protein
MNSTPACRAGGFNPPADTLSHPAHVPGLDADHHAHRAAAQTCLADAQSIPIDLKRFLTDPNTAHADRKRCLVDASEVPLPTSTAPKRLLPAPTPELKAPSRQLRATSSMLWRYTPLPAKHPRRSYRGTPTYLDSSGEAAQSVGEGARSIGIEAFRYAPPPEEVPPPTYRGRGVGLESPLPKLKTASITAFCVFIMFGVPMATGRNSLMAEPQLRPTNLIR